MKTPKLNRRELLVVAAAGAGNWAWGERSVSAGRTAKPNILLIVSDQQHWQALGVVNPFFDTPNVDRLAKSGVRFTDAFCTTPQCSPSRSSIYTGFYPHKTTVIGNVGSTDHHGERLPGLPQYFETLGSRLQAAGYHTGYYGKWHLENDQHFAAHFDEEALDGDEHEGATAGALAFLEARAQQPGTPFALCVNYINPHDVYAFVEVAAQPDLGLPNFRAPRPDSWSETFAGKPDPQQRYMTADEGKCLRDKPEAYWEQYRVFYREKCRLLDEQAGCVLDKLEALGLAEDTVVVFTSDHGDMDTHHRLIFKGPFMYEHVVRVPLIVRVPARHGGVRGEIEGFALGVDILPTLCDFAGAPLTKCDGQSWRNALTHSGPAPSRDYVVAEYYNKQKWVNPIRMIRTQDFKYNYYIDHGEELYDLKNDPDEMVNRAGDAAFRETKRLLANTLREWMTDNKDAAFEDYWATNRDGTLYHT